MSDDITPYSQAIEETAKTAGKAIDALREGAHAVSGPVANIYGILIGDRIDAARERNLDAISRKTKRILADRDLEETAPVSEQMAIPLLEAARGESRDELQDLWASLLANAMDPNLRDDVRPAFVTTLKRLQPVDAVVLWEIAENGTGSYTTSDDITEQVKLRKTLVSISLETLVADGCVQTSKGYFRITSYGLEFVRACSSKRDNGK